RGEARSGRSDRTGQSDRLSGQLRNAKRDFCGCFCYARCPRERDMETKDRIYFARRAAEEQERASAASDPHVAEAHRQLQRAYLERASVGDRAVELQA